MYDAGQDVSNSPYVAIAMGFIKRGLWWHNCKSIEEVRKYQKDIFDLYEKIKCEGYSQQGRPVSVWFDSAGFVHVYDGNHRIAIMRYLGIDPILEVKLVRFGKPPMPKDFPLAQTLRNINHVFGIDAIVYDPVDDERVKNFRVWRKDSQHRLDYILSRLSPQCDVLDVGCSEGYFSLALAGKGYNVTAIDMDMNRVAITRYLATIKNLKVKCGVSEWQYFLHSYYDVVLMLSVLHVDMAHKGVEQTFDSLKLVRGKVGRLFVESPLTSAECWRTFNRAKLFNFTEAEFAARVAEETGMKLVDTWHPTVDRYGFRPIFLLES
jgi:SAM-dependent methyltransferase